MAINDYNEWYLNNRVNRESEKIQNAYQLAYFLHPQDDVAFSVLNEGFDKARLLAKTIDKRPYSNQPHKLLVSSEDLLHIGVMTASEGFEIYQELENSQQRNMSRYANNYQPTFDDFVIRYVKKIYSISNDRTARYLAIGIGTLLYNYKTVEILGISEYFDNNNSSKIKRFYENSLLNRFPSIDTRQSSPIEGRTAKLIECCFDIFTLPSIRNTHFNQNLNIRNEYFSYHCDKSEREKFAVFMKFGLARLIDEYNNYLPYGHHRIDDPINRLMLPETPNRNFDQSEQNFKDRIKQSVLNEEAIQVMHTFLKKDNMPIIKLINKRKNTEDDVSLIYSDE